MAHEMTADVRFKKNGENGEDFSGRKLVALPTEGVRVDEQLREVAGERVFTVCRPSLYLASVTVTGCHGRGSDKCLPGSMPAARLFAHVCLCVCGSA